MTSKAVHFERKSLQSSRNVSSSSDQRTTLYTEAEHLSTFSQIEAIDYHTTHTVSSIRFTPYPAGHVLGAAMFLIEIAGLKILFTGDYSREDDRHLVSAEIPKGIKIDVLITESTYGIASHIPRAERETALMKSVTGILNRGGRVLMPVFALGRAQELLLILDDYWARHPEFQRIPIYYASNLARKCMVVYQTYVSAMNDNIKRLFRERMAEAEQAGDVDKGGPWDFRFIRSLKNLERFDDVGGCIVLASPGMLQSGVSRELLERWAPNDRNGVVITGYSVEGTMAKQIMNEPDSIPAIMSRTTAGVGRRGLGANGEAERPMIPRRCSVQEYSFAAHVDGQENQGFIEEVAASVVVSTTQSQRPHALTSINKKTNIDPSPRRKTQHDAPQIQAPLPKQRQSHQNQNLQPGQHRRTPHPLQSRQGRPRRRPTRSTPSPQFHRPGRRTPDHRRSRPKRLQDVTHGTRRSERIRWPDNDDNNLQTTHYPQRGRHRSHQMGTRRDVRRYRADQPEEIKATIQRRRRNERGQHGSWRRRRRRGDRPLSPSSRFSSHGLRHRPAPEQRRSGDRMGRQHAERWHRRCSLSCPIHGRK